MPRDKKKRGRRAETQKRHHDDSESDDTPQKRQKTSNELPQDADLDEVDAERHVSAEPEGADLPDRPTFYGTLDEGEQEYFKHADELLETNQFADDEERQLFLSNVYKEADGKELKLVSSQSCSRLMERLILLSSPLQLKALFQKFSGHFLQLMQHRFASHCCETLFTQAAPVVSQELSLPLEATDKAEEQNGEVYVSMENLFLYAINELSGNLGYLITERFASHTLRVLLVVLSGQPLDSSSQKLVQSKRKEKIEVGQVELPSSTQEKRRVPQSFGQALQDMIKDSVGGFDTPFLRTLAVHQTGNPMLQLLIQIELSHSGKQRGKDEDSIIKRLLPDDPLKEGTESANFVNGLLYDPIGSRLLETIVEYAPGKIFKSLYRECFKDRMGALARNEISGYVVVKVLERLSREDLTAALDSILPQIQGLVERGRTTVIRTLVERCHTRRIDMEAIAARLRQHWSDDGETVSILRLLQFPQTTPVANGTAQSTNSTALETLPPKSPATTHVALLAQSILSVSGAASSLLFTSIAALDSQFCTLLAKDTVLSRILQTSLTSPYASLIFRRKLITRLYGHIGELALDVAGSHLVDAIWRGTQGMAFARERVAEELAENELALRESLIGRKVWKNWRMDQHKRRRGDWVRQMRNEVGNEGFQSFPADADLTAEKTRVLRNVNVRSNGNGVATRTQGQGPETRRRQNTAATTAFTNGKETTVGKTSLQLARERYARANKSKLQQGTSASRDD